ncbi:MAG: two-component system response regulator AlgR [Parvicella sp.]|jgi:two-component system response regulator AlgR
MKCLIVDDEGLARSRLKHILGDLDESMNVIESDNGKDALAKCNDYEPELVFLDIRMPGISGMEVAQHLTAYETPPAVIFTTAYNEFALDAFEANAIDYLLKPIRRERLQQALKKIKPFTAEQKLKLPTEEARQHIALTERGKIKLVPIDKIVYFRADNKYVRLRTTKREYVISEVLNGLEEELADQFIRVHRNSLVAKSHINRLEKDSDNGKWYVFFKSIEDSIEVSRRQTTNVRKWLRNKS